MYEDVAETLEAMRDRLDRLAPDAGYKHDAYILQAVREAGDASAEGNFGVGAVIVDRAGDIVERGHNHVFWPHFRSDIHAEMDVLNKFEESHRSLNSISGYSLYTSLEPCPMCLTRLITSGITNVYYAADDVESGMVSRLDALTPVWVALAADQNFEAAECSPQLKDLALKLFLVTAKANTERLARRR
jgi:tRNA(adenine34) deaminase